MSKLTFIICMILALVIGVVIGIGWMCISHEGLDGEYFRALKTVGGSGVNWIDAIFRYCVVLLVNMAKVIGISYEVLHMGIHNRPTTHHLVTVYLGNPTSEKTQKMTTLLIIFTLLLNLSYENSALSADFRDCETEFNAKKYETAARVREQ